MQENTIILVSNTQIETEPNVAAQADQSIDYNRNNTGGGYSTPKTRSRLEGKDAEQQYDDSNLYQVVDVNVRRPRPKSNFISENPLLDTYEPRPTTPGSSMAGCRADRMQTYNSNYNSASGSEDEEEE